MATLADFAFKELHNNSTSGRNLYECKVAGVYKILVWVLNSRYHYADAGKKIQEFANGGNFNYQFVLDGASADSFSDAETRHFMSTYGLSSMGLDNIEVSTDILIAACFQARAEMISSCSPGTLDTLRSSKSSNSGCCELCNGTKVRDFVIYKRDCECTLR